MGEQTQIYSTGYYSKVNQYKDLGYKTVGISVTWPKGVVLDGRIPELSPDDSTLWDFKNGKIDEEEYTRQYLNKLEKIGIRDILLKIHSFGDNVVLLCWESPEKFCHRHLLADFINKNSKLEVNEKMV